MNSVICNKDIPVLVEVLSIMQEIRRLEERKQWVGDRMINVTQHLSWTAGGGGKHDFSDGYADLQEVEAEIDAKLSEYRQRLAKAEAVLNGIADLNMRTFVAMLYVEKFTSKKVMTELNMSRRTFDNARSAIENAPDMARAQWRGNFEENFEKC